MEDIGNKLTGALASNEVKLKTIKNDKINRKNKKITEAVDSIDKSLRDIKASKKPTKASNLIKFNTEKQPAQLSSVYLKEITMSLEDRLALCGKQSSIPEIVEFVDIGENSCHKETQVPVDQPLFHATPSKVVFQNFDPFKKYEAMLSFRNRDKVARRLKVESLESPYFSVVPLKSGPPNGSRVAPGMEICYILQFKPEVKRDYFCQVVCVTDREKFVIPVEAKGSRGILDFQNEINFSECPVKFVSNHTLYVRNIGNAPARVIIEAEEPFSISPHQTTVMPQQAVQFEVSFYPQSIGKYEKYISILYDTGESVIVKALGSAEDVAVGSESDMLVMNNTYIGLASSQNVRLYN
ncbi:hypothetical protein ROZALSC1DRAFT_24188, partial [Rozella allomycis CSF55]